MIQQTLSSSAVEDDIWAPPGPQEQDLVALKEAVRKIAALLESSSVKEDEIIADFQKARRGEIEVPA